jgi:hypothetical protein
LKEYIFFIYIDADVLRALLLRFHQLVNIAASKLISSGSLHCRGDVFSTGGVGMTSDGLIEMVIGRSILPSSRSRTLESCIGIVRLIRYVYFSDSMLIDENKVAGYNILRTLHHNEMSVLN